MTSDTPEACPFCGAKIEPCSTDEFGRMEECGLYFYDDVPGWKFVRSADCYERQIAAMQPKAVAFDRLEEMARHKGVELAQWSQDSFICRTSLGRWNTTTKDGPDLASAIGAAWGMFKGEQK